MRKTVLLIDDDADEHLWFSEALENYNSAISCITAYSCSQGYNRIKDSPPDWIFLDFNLPGTNGLECLMKIKKTPSLKNVPVYMYSASRVSDQVRAQALETGALKWIAKPNALGAYQKIFSEVFE